MRKLLCLSALVCVVWATTEVVPLGHEAIRYTQTSPADDIQDLEKRIASGKVQMKPDPVFGYLPALLKALDIPTESQILVFSKTSFQAARINPVTPRAIYFNDRVSIGFVSGGEVLEVAAQDPKQGVIFYTLDQDPQSPPTFVRRDDACLQCHVNHTTSDVPGFMIRSVYPEPSGMPYFQAGGFVTDHRSPLAERWGGWFVTGKHGSQTHMGNAFARDRQQPDKLDTETSLNRTELPNMVHRDEYLTGHSDIVALMVAEHQFRGINLITRLNFEARLAIHQRDLMTRLLGEPSVESSQSAKRRIARQADELADYLLMGGEAKLTDSVEGTTSFAKLFSAKGPKDKQGRGLRQLDLKQRLFRYPLSYLVYSPAFAQLPDEALEAISKRLAARLATPEYAEIRQILAGTRDQLPAPFVTALASVGAKE
jgi:hypothetical protein